MILQKETQALPEMSHQPEMIELAKLWPTLDRMSQDEFRTYFAKLTTSWVNYSGSMSQIQKQEMLSREMVELRRKIEGAKEINSLLEEKQSPSSQSSTKV